MKLKAFLALSLIGISLAGAPSAYAQTVQPQAPVSSLAPIAETVKDTAPKLNLTPHMFERTNPAEIIVPLSGSLKFTIMSEERRQIVSNLDPRRGVSRARQFRADRSGLGTYDQSTLASANIRLKF